MELVEGQFDDAEDVCDSNDLNSYVTVLTV